MVSSSFEGAVRRLLKARVTLSMREPFISASLMRLPFKAIPEASWCPTMCTDGYHIFFNPDWTDDLSLEELQGVIAHEALHVIFGHSDRRGSRDATRWNIACDHAINLFLCGLDIKLPAGGLMDARYRGMTAEAIYRHLDEDASYPKGESGVSQGVGAGGSSPMVGIGGDLIDADDLRAKAVADKDAPDQEGRRLLRSELGKDAGDKLQGTSRGFFAEEISIATQRKLDWRQLLRRLLNERIRSDWSTYPFSKKHLWRDIYLPSIGVESPGHIVFAVDTSGSMSSHELGEIFSELRGLRESFPCPLTVIQVDAAIQRIDVFDEYADTPLEVGSVEVVGRGGTDFRPVFNELEKLNQPPAMLLFATDGYGSFPQRAPNIPVIWLLTANARSTEKFPFGLTVKIE